MSSAAEAASAVVQDFIAEGTEEAPAEDQPEPVVEEEEPAAPVFEVEIPADVQALLEEEDEPVYQEPVAEYEQEQEYEDPDKLRRELHATQKKLAFMEAQRTKDNIKGWREEARRYFPLADVDAIEGTSKREILRVAQAEHVVAKRGADRVAAHWEANVEKIVAERVAEAEAKLTAAWGRPLSGPGQMPVQAAEQQEAIQELQNARTLHERIKIKMAKGML